MPVPPVARGRRRRGQQGAPLSTPTPQPQPAPDLGPLIALLARLIVEQRHSQQG